MSAPGPLRVRLGRALVALYPEPWRARYASEMEALLEDDPPGPRGLISLVSGAADAHLRPRPALLAASSTGARLRLSITGIFCCWIALSAIGLSFQKETEEGTFAIAAERHPLLGIAHDAALVGPILGAAVIAFGGLPLVWQALGAARARRDRRLAALLLLPGAAIAGFAGLTWLLLAIAPSTSGGVSLPLAVGILLPWWLGGLACAATCALTPRAVLARVEIGSSSLRRASRAGVALSLLMGLITLALVGYASTLALLAPGLAGESGGPLWPSTGAVLGLGAGLAAGATAMALLSAARARRALLGQR